jgi:hypothetical protein
VRVIAGEVRKRLAQYYYEPEHRGELRIELHPGSYVPEFKLDRVHDGKPYPARQMNSSLRQNSRLLFRRSRSGLTMTREATTLLSARRIEPERSSS